MKIITPKGKANELIIMVRGLVSETFFSPYVSDCIKTKICSYNLAIEFCNNVIDSLKFYNIQKMKYWKQVKTELIEIKLYFYESQNQRITEELEQLKNKK
jgi:hypothetical protein